MINNEWERFGEDIRRTIQDAVDSRDFSRLKPDSVRYDRAGYGQCFQGIEKTVDGTGDSQQKETGGSRQTYTPGYDPRQKTSTVALRERKQMLYLKGNSARIGGAFLGRYGIHLRDRGDRAAGLCAYRRRSRRLGPGAWSRSSGAGDCGSDFCPDGRDWNKYALQRGPLPEICEDPG